MKKRNRAVDIARGIAMISIVMGHMGEEKVNRIVYTYHLPVFFLISGWFFNEKSSLKEFLQKKFKGLIIPYLAICLGLCLAAFVYGLIHGGDIRTLVFHTLLASLYGAGDAYQEPFVIYSIGAVWFLLATFWAELFLKLISLCKKEIQPVLVFGIFFLSLYTREHLFWLPLSIQAAGPALIYMYTAWTMRKLWPSLHKIWKKEYTVLITLTAITMEAWFIVHFKGFWLVHNEMGNGFIDMVCSFAGVYLLLLFSKLLDHWEPIAKLTAWIGQHSLLFLGVHIIELTWLSWNQLFIPMNILPGTKAFFFLCTAAKLVLILLVMALLLKSRMIRQIFGYQKR
jgi:fucose 4-O-acetylase-like acetyltransferase